MLINDFVCLSKILQAAETARRFVEDINYCQFEKDAKTQFAVAWQLMAIGKTAQHFSPEIKELLPSINWEGFSALFASSDTLEDPFYLEDVYNAAKVSIPNILNKIKPLMAAGALTVSANVLREVNTPKLPLLLIAV